MIFSSDWPVAPVEVMLSIQAAVAPAALPPPWRDQHHSLMEALHSYTARLTICGGRITHDQT